MKCKYLLERYTQKKYIIYILASDIFEKDDNYEYKANNS